MNNIFDEQRFEDDFARASQRFDQTANTIAKTAKRGLIVFFAIWLFYILCSLAVIGGLGFIAFHFLSKVW